LPPGPVREYLPGLLEAANAKGATPDDNFRAYQALNTCRAQQKMEEAKVSQQSRAAASGTDDKPVQARVASNEPDCRGVEPKDLADTMRYLKRAAEGGDDRAAYHYASGIPVADLDQADLIKHPEAVLEWRTNSIRYLSNAIENGNTDALFALARAYQEGTLGEQNPALAYQYALAWRQLQYPPDNPIVDNYPNRLAKNLTPEQIAQAQLAAQALVTRMRTPR
jgi:hypothetical protein